MAETRFTLESAKRHIDRFGPDAVMDTAIESYHAGTMTLADLCSLQTHIDEHEKKKNRWARKHRKTVEQRVKQLLGISDEKESEAT